MKEILKLGSVLAAFAVVACVALALVNNATAPAIAANKAAEANAGMSVVFPQADSFEAITDFTVDNIAPAKIEGIYVAKSNDEVIGSVVQMFAPTYEKAVVLVAVDMNKNIIGNTFLELSDTPGFGQKARENNYMDQYNGKSAEDAFELGSDLVAISGATITSKALALLMKASVYAAGELLAKRFGAEAGTAFVPVDTGYDIYTVEQAFADIYGADVVSSASIKNVTKKVTSIPVKDKTILGVYTVELDGKIAAAAVELAGLPDASYDYGTMITVVDLNRKIVGSRVTSVGNASENESNNGLKALSSAFYNQFTGKSVDDLFIIGENVDAVSHATSSSQSLADFVKIGGYAAADYLAQNYDGDPAPAGSENYQLNK
ncbi:MAG: FMN-binding protein [Treponemataceae bacterium]